MVSSTLPRNIFLIGFMGSGKSTVGRILSGKIGFAFIDLDELIERREGVSVSDIFESRGEEGFRDIESEVLREIVGQENNVVSTGGGVVLREGNRDLMSGSGVTVYLRTPAWVVWERIRRDTSRPLLRVENPFERICELLGERTALYELADVVVDTDSLTPEEVAEKIIERLEAIG